MDHQINNHQCFGTIKSAWTHEYKEMIDKLNLLEKQDILLHNKLVELNRKKYKQDQKQLLQEYGDNKYKIVYKDGTILYTNTYDILDLNIARIETLVKLNNSYNRVNVLEHKENTNTDTIRIYNEAYLLSEKQVLSDDRTQVVNSIQNRKYANLSCMYFGMNNAYRISFFNQSVNLVTICINAKSGECIWYHGTMFKKGCPDDGIELFKRLKEKFKDDSDIMYFLDKVSY